LKTFGSIALMLGLLTSAVVSAQQSFEGIITYEIDLNYTDSNSVLLDINDSIMRYSNYESMYFDYYGDIERHYYARNGDVLITHPYSGKIGQDFILFKKDSNKTYRKHHGMDSIYVRDFLYDSDIYLVSDYDSDITVLDQKCRNIQIEKIEENNAYDYFANIYYSGYPFLSKTTANAQPYGNQKAFEIAQSPYLRMEVKFFDVHFIKFAQEIEEKELEEALFKIPEGIPFAIR